MWASTFVRGPHSTFPMPVCLPSGCQVNTDFENLPTIPLEHRPGFDKVAILQWPHGPPANHHPWDLMASDFVEAMQVQNAMQQLPPWQQLVDLEQLILLVDNLYSTVSVDKMTVFGVRLPELQYVNNQRLYFWWFHRLKPVAHGFTAVYCMRQPYLLSTLPLSHYNQAGLYLAKTLAYVNGHSRGSNHLEPLILQLFHIMGQYYSHPLMQQANHLQRANGRIFSCARWTSSTWSWQNCTNHCTKS